MDELCTVYNAAELIGKKWTLLILLEIYKGKSSTRRYGELKDKIPKITPKILSQRLKELDAKGLIKKRIDASTTPIRCEYTLTASGEGLIGIIKKIKEWSLKHHMKNKACENITCKNCTI